jgi:hypothetical protein
VNNATNMRRRPITIFLASHEKCKHVKNQKNMATAKMAAKLMNFFFHQKMTKNWTG